MIAATMRALAFLLVLILFAPTWASGAPTLPDPKLTPGTPDPHMTAAHLCAKDFSTKQTRNVTAAEKHEVYRRYGLLGARTGYCATKSGCEVDHLISLEIGGSNDIQNLWPQSYDSKPWNAHVKDKLENALHRAVCHRQMTLQQAQTCISKDWIACYRKMIGEPK